MSAVYELGYPETADDANLTVNGTFDTDSDWTKEPGWTITGGVAHCDVAGGVYKIYQDHGLVTGKVYKVTFTILNYISGFVTPVLGGTGDGTTQSGDGTYEEFIVATGSILFMRTSNAFGFKGDIDNVSVHCMELVTLYPEFDLWKGEKQVRTDTRAKSGRLRMYKWYDYDRIKFGLEWVPASDAALVNSWWDTNAELLFFVTSDSVSEVHSVMIINGETPLAAYNKPYNNYYKGKIELEGY